MNRNVYLDLVGVNRSCYMMEFCSPTFKPRQLYKTMAMVLYLCILLPFALFDVMNAADPELQCPNNYTSTTTQIKLRKQVFCKYDKFIRPVRSHNESVNVEVRLTLRRLDFDDKNDKLTIFSLFHISWNDYHLLWNKSEFDNIDTLRVMSTVLWRPDFDIYTASTSWPSLQFFYSICMLHSVGSVICVPALQQETGCSADLTRWPFDSHTCEMVIGSWAHTGEEINISLSAEPIDTYDYEMNREWELVSTKATREVEKFECCPDETYPSVTFQFVLKRHSGVYAATVIIPAIVLMMMTLLTFWMDPGRSERLFITALDMFCHFMFLQYIETMLPSNGDKTPLLITFYRDSLILTTMALFCALLGRNLKSSSQPVPLWAVGISSWILDNRIGQTIVFLNFNQKPAPEVSGTESEGQTKMANLSSSSSWDAFLAIQDSLLFIVTLLVYVILMLGFIP